MQVHTKILPKATRELIPCLVKLKAIKNFYLSGGTALALQLGHRESEDLDFFSEIDFNPEILQEDLTQISPIENSIVTKGTLNTFMENVKLQFLYYPYKLLEKPISWNGLLLSSIIDNACTKLITVSARGSKKDFIDLYILLKEYSLQDLFDKLDQKYKGINYNHAHILKSLIYFNDAEGQPMPKMHIPVDWNDVKQTLINKVKEFKI